LSKRRVPTKVKFSPQATEDILFWEKSGNKKAIKKILDLINDCLKTPYSGIGSPEQLRYQARDTYSRRIDRVNRLVYIVDGEDLFIISARYHYEK
jgi:toxin YoeB